MPYMSIEDDAESSQQKRWRALRLQVLQHLGPFSNTLLPRWWGTAANGWTHLATKLFVTFIRWCRYNTIYNTGNDMQEMICITNYT